MVQLDKSEIRTRISTAVVAFVPLSLAYLLLLNLLTTQEHSLFKALCVAEVRPVLIENP
jgi:hypothetical protein